MLTDCIRELNIHLATHYSPKAASTVRTYNWILKTCYTQVRAYGYVEHCQGLLVELEDKHLYQAGPDLEALFIREGHKIVVGRTVVLGMKIEPNCPR